MHDWHLIFIVDYKHIKIITFNFSWMQVSGELDQCLKSIFSMMIWCTKSSIKHFPERKPDSVFGINFTVNFILFFGRSVSFIPTILILCQNTTKQLCPYIKRFNWNICSLSASPLLNILRKLYAMCVPFILCSPNKWNEKSLCSLFMPCILVNDFQQLRTQKKTNDSNTALYSFLFYSIQCHFPFW